MERAGARAGAACHGVRTPSSRAAAAARGLSRGTQRSTQPRGRATSSRRVRSRAAGLAPSRGSRSRRAAARRAPTRRRGRSRRCSRRRRRPPPAAAAARVARGARSRAPRTRRARRGSRPAGGARSDRERERGRRRSGRCSLASVPRRSSHLDRDARDAEARRARVGLEGGERARRDPVITRHSSSDTCTAMCCSHTP